MAGINIGSAQGGRRALTHDIPLIPFIDFLLCLVAFLLVTAVWTDMARLDAAAQIVGDPATAADPPVLTMHVEADSRGVAVRWKQGDVVVHSRKLNHQPVPANAAALGAELSAEWNAHNDVEIRSTAVVHAANDLSYEQVITVIDAISSVKTRSGSPAFAASLAMN